MNNEEKKGSIFLATAQSTYILFSILIDSRNEIIQTWVESIFKSLPVYLTRPREELLERISRNFDSIITFLMEGNEEPSLTFIHDLSALRKKQNFSLSEVWQAIAEGEQALLKAYEKEKGLSRIDTLTATLSIKEAFQRQQKSLISGYESAQKKELEWRDAHIKLGRKERMFLKDKLAFSDSILSAIGLGIIVTDQHENVIWINKTLPSCLLKISRKRVLGKTLSDSLIQKIVTDKTFLPLKKGSKQIIKVQCKNEERRFLSLSQPIREQNWRMYLFLDVTKQEQLSENLMKTQDMLKQKESLAILGEMSAAIAHEIKNPIAGIRGAIEMMSPVHNPEDKRFEIFQEVRKQIQRLEGLIKDLLSFARDQKPHKREVPATLIIEGALNQASDAIERSGVKISKEIKSGIILHVDPEQIMQVFINLIYNAIQAMDDAGGSLAIKADKNRDGKIFFSFEDSGKGIKEEDIDKIFNPFYTTKHIGTGLGLSIVVKILSANGGSINVATRYGMGSTFTVVLPSN